MIRFTCRRCSRAFNLHDEEAGSREDCPGCGEGLVVPEKGARARALLGTTGIVAAVLLVLAAMCIVPFIAPKLAQSRAMVVLYILMIVVTGALAFRLIGRKRADRSMPIGNDKLKIFLDAYPDYATPQEPEPAATCRKCGKALEPGAVICAACGLVCPLCQSSASGLAGDETHHLECPRCGGYWITRPLYDRMLYGDLFRLRTVFLQGRIAPDDTSKTDPFCERDLELLEDGWSLEQAMEIRRRGRDPT